MEQQRVNIESTLPEAYKAMRSLSASLSKTGLTPVQKELIKIRASQINACAFYLDMLTKEALKNYKTQQRIFLLNAWRETNLFTDEEKAILALTEEVTLISDQGVTEKTYKEAEKFFSAEVIAQIIMSIVLINGWNRIAVSTHLPIGK